MQIVRPLTPLRKRMLEDMTDRNFKRHFRAATPAARAGGHLSLTPLHASPA